MDSVQPGISLIYTTNNEKNVAPKVRSKKNFKNHISGFVADFRRFAPGCKYSAGLHLDFHLNYHLNFHVKFT